MPAGLTYSLRDLSCEREDKALSIIKKLLPVAAGLVIAACSIGCPKTEEKPAGPVVTFSAAGELYPVAEGAPLFPTAKARQAMPDIMPLLVSRDLVLVDLAGGIEHGCQPLIREKLYRWPPEWVDLLSETNIRVLSLANDHAIDCGREALMTAWYQMTAQGFAIVGAGKDQREAHAPVYLTRSGITIGIVSFLTFQPPGVDPCPQCAGPSLYDRQALINALKEMKKRSMHRLVVFHLPDRDLPELTDEEMAAFRDAVDAGADFVIGYGPDSAGGIHRIKGRWAVASMGRLSGLETLDPGKITDGLILSVEFSLDRIMNLRLLAVDLDHGRPRLVRGEEGAAVLAALQESADDAARDNTELIEDVLYLK